jgi:acetylornithine aminotransferase
MIVQKEASLPNADPPADSQTARLVTDQLGYMVPTYVRPPPMFHKGEGCYMWDVENRKYLDFTAGIAVTSLGHAEPEISKQLYQQVCLNAIRNAAMILRVTLLGQHNHTHLEPLP